MKLVALSDIHSDINKSRRDPNFNEYLIEHIISLNPDVLLITGDIAGKNKDIINFLEACKRIKIPHKLFVPGNHDLWVNSKSNWGSWIKYYRYYPELCKEYNWHYLPKNPIKINNISFFGTSGWYDYSLRNKIWDDKFDENIYKNKIHPQTNLTWSDKYFIRFGNFSDYDITSQFIEDLKADFEKLNLKLKDQYTKRSIDNKISDYDTVVIASHFAPYQKFVKYYGKSERDFFTAYYGSEDLGKIIDEISDNYRRIAIFGHVHNTQIRKMENNVEAYCVPIGYPHEYGHDKDMNELFSQKIIEIEI